ncbi:hypothetical protein LTR15_012514 [Elasticomyces elasticus]|nr:hypothetical protein LTR15_012514 [Elasticomyces elasticus]
MAQLSNLPSELISELKIHDICELRQVSHWVEQEAFAAFVSAHAHVKVSTSRHAIQRFARVGEHSQVLAGASRATQDAKGTEAKPQARSPGCAWAVSKPGLVAAGIVDLPNTSLIALSFLARVLRLVTLSSGSVS